ncbi:ABC transporter permease [Lactococcus hircilactis]|uniref:ABC transporter permease n=1 Tax=Lactococcus hircilactis TaxID=1494462 RepID=A0A7X1Z8Q1_9LACT|nr:ABC transporter permease [Lactococcus hircilactis]MQW39334.1 ABC transporter permease [Lactococcus hircilactis]
MKNQTWLVAKNIYRNRIKGAGFWALVLSPFLMAAIYLVIGLVVSSGVNATPHLAVVNAPIVAKVLKQDHSLNVDISEVSERSKAQEKLSKDSIDGYLIQDGGSYTIVTGKKSAVKFDQTSFQAALSQLKMSQTAQKLDISAANVQALLTPAKLTIQTQTSAGKTSEAGDQMGANIAVGSVSSILIFVLLMMYVGIIGQEIGNEKSSRIMETLLAATSSNVQYYGKIIGVILLAFTQIGIYVVGFAALYPFIKTQAVVIQIQSMLSGIDLGFGIYLALMTLVGILGYLFLASIVASLVNEQAQVQQATQPIAFLSMVGYIGGIAGAAVPGNLILKVLSFIPFVSPTLMTSRFAIQYATATQAWIALFLQLVGTVLIAKAGEKIYARNVLSYSDDKIMTQLIRNITGAEKSKPKKEKNLDQKKKRIQPWRVILAVVIIIIALIYRFFIK